MTAALPDTMGPHLPPNMRPLGITNLTMADRDYYVAQAREVVARDAELTAKPDLIPERLLAASFAFYMGIFTQREWPEGSWQAAELDKLCRLGRDFPGVRVRAECAWLRERSQELLFSSMGGARSYLKAQEIGLFKTPDEAIDQKFRKWIDKGAVPEDHGGYLPSQILTVLCGIQGRDDGLKLYKWALAGARQRYREGFEPNPFAKNPRRRPV